MLYKKIFCFIAIILMATSCSQEELVQEPLKGKALLQFNLSALDDAEIITRATPLPAVDTFWVVVRDNNNDTIVNKRFRELQMDPLYLEVGEEGTEYKVEAYSYELKDAILDKPCFYASKDTMVNPNEIVHMQLKCKLQQIQVSFKPTQAFKDAFKKDDFLLTVSDNRGRSVEYKMDDLGKSAYFDGREGHEAEYLKVSVHATTKKGFPVNYSNEYQKKDKKPIGMNDHFIFTLSVSEGKATTLEVTTIE